MASEVKAQEFVHQLEHGKGRWWILFGLILALAGVLFTSFLFIHVVRAMSRSERIADALDWYAQFGAAGARGDLVQSQTCAWTSSVFGKPGIAD